MNFNRFFLVAIILVLLSGQFTVSLNLIAVQVVEKSEDIAEERLEQFVTQHRQKFLAKKPIHVKPQSSPIAVGLSQEFSIAQPVPPARIYLRNKVLLT